jgi:hypothetical protein
MSTKIDWKNALMFVAGVIIILMIADNESKKRKIAELKEALQANDFLANELKGKLEELVKTHPDIDPKIANELTHISALIGINLESKALLSLAKVIENLLKEFYKDSDNFKIYLETIKKKRPSFHDYLEFAKNDGIIAQEEYHLLAVLKIIRNQEAHELDVKKEKGKIVACFVSGVSVTIGLCKLLKKAA